MVQKKTIFIALSIAAITLLPLALHAGNNNFNLKTKFRDAIAIQNIVEIDYGVISYNGTPAANDIYINPADSSMSCTNNSNYTCPTVGTAGSFLVTGELGATVEISCDQTGRVALSNERLDLKLAEIHVDSTTSSCNSLNTTSATHVIANATLDDTISIGATLEVPAAGIVLFGEYSTSNSSGNAIKVRVKYQ